MRNINENNFLDFIKDKENDLPEIKVKTERYQKQFDKVRLRGSQIIISSFKNWMHLKSNIEIMDFKNEEEFYEYYYKTVYRYLLTHFDKKTFEDEFDFVNVDGKLVKEIMALYNNFVVSIFFEI